MKNKLLLNAIALIACLTIVEFSYGQEDKLPPKPKNLDQMIEQLGDSKTKDQAIGALVEYCDESKRKRSRAVETLVDVAKRSQNLVQRGWAIAALAEIGGLDVDDLLLNIHSDDKQQMVVRTWAAGARVKMTTSTAGLIEKANLVSQFPALGRPIGLRLVEQLSKDESADAEDVIRVTMKVPNLAAALAPAIMAFGKDKLVKAMVTAQDQEVRRMAASYLATMAAQGDGEVAEPVIAAFKFASDAKQVPWKDGPLFIPSISWGEEDAKALVGNLMRWLIYCDQQDDSDSIRQIHNNIRSLSLAQAAGYQSPGWNDIGAEQWLVAWGKAMGVEEVEAILAEQEIDEKEYADALAQLKAS